MYIFKYQFITFKAWRNLWKELVSLQWSINLMHCSGSLLSEKLYFANFKLHFYFIGLVSDYIICRLLALHCGTESYALLLAKHTSKNVCVLKAIEILHSLCVLKTKAYWKCLPLPFSELHQHSNLSLSHIVSITL